MNDHPLTEAERYQISALLEAKLNQKEIAALLKRSPATISRELKRNRGFRGYRPAQAQRFSHQRRTSAHKAVKVSDEMSLWIEKLLRQELSPQQAVDYLKRHKKISLHHETLYQILYADKAEELIFINIFESYQNLIESAMVVMNCVEKSKIGWLMIIVRRRLGAALSVKLTVVLATGKAIPL